MARYILFVLVFCALLCLNLSLSTNAQTRSIHPSHLVPLEKGLSEEWKKSLWSQERKVYKGAELTTIGMPCGGVAAGQLYVTGDGTLANWWIANNAYNTGYGIDWLLDFNTPLGPWKVCYQTFEPTKYIEQGFQVRIKQQGKEYNKKLSKEDFDNISFVGEYPIATINYESSSSPIPVSIQSQVYSPFIPLNARESATPATILNFRFKNHSSEKAEINITGWLQNLVCLELKEEATAISRNRVVKSRGVTSVYMDLIEDRNYKTPLKKLIMIEDFESGTLDKWKKEGTAFGSAPVIRTAKGQQQDVKGFEGEYLINSFSSAGEDTATGKLTSRPFKIVEDYIIFRIGGGSHKDKTCINLVVNGKVVKTATGDNDEKLSVQTWDVKEFRNKKAVIEIVDNERGSWGHINLDNIGMSNQPGKQKYYPGTHPYFGNLSLSVIADDAMADADYRNGGTSADESAEKYIGEPLIGATGTTITLEAGEEQEATFILSWYFPNRPMQYGEGGNWNRPIPTEGPAIGNMYANWYSSSTDVATWVSNNYSRLREKTFAFHDAYYNNSTLPYWLIQRLMMPVSTLATETCQWWANDKFWAWEGVGSCVGTCTHVWNYEQALAHLFPELERNIREKTDYATSFQEDGSIQARNGWGGVLIDGHAGAILKAYREHLNSKDNLFLSRNWDKIRKATLFIIGEDGNNDGLIEKEQANTYDIAFYGANTYVGSLYLASLRAASEMAILMKDSAFALKCDSIFETGKKLSSTRLWNGEYFIQDVDLQKHPQFQYGTGCLSDQVFGQTWAHLYQLGYIYPENQVKQALRSVWKYNWAPQVGAQTRVHLPERTYAAHDEAGLLIATWPFDKHMGEDGVRYRDEVWTGIEYQVATNMIYEGMIDEALTIVKAVHDRYDGEKHNPWNEIECGDHYARALASWGVLRAMQGFQYDGPNGFIAFSPVQKNNFSTFFTSAEGWGNYKRTVTATALEDQLELKYGKLNIRKIGLLSETKPLAVKVEFNGKQIPASFEFNAGKIEIRFETIEISEGQKLIITTDIR